MSDPVFAEEAEVIAGLMPKLARGLFVADHDPAADLPLAQLRVCGILTDGPRAMSALSRDLGVTLSAMTQIADRLDRAGWVRRVAEESDRRVRCLQLTPRGERMMKRRHQARVARVAAVLEQVPPEMRNEIRASLEALLAACTAAQFAAARRDDPLPRPLSLSQ